MKRSDSPTWGYFQEEFDPQVMFAATSLRKARVVLRDVMAPESRSQYRVVRWIAEAVAVGRYPGVIVFCREPGLWCCVANKIAGVRAVPAVTVAQTRKALDGLGANWIAVESPGRTYYEIRQILRVCALRPATMPPPEVSHAIRDLEGKNRARR